MSKLKMIKNVILILLFITFTLIVFFIDLSRRDTVLISTVFALMWYFTENHFSKKQKK